MPVRLFVSHVCLWSIVSKVCRWVTKGLSPSAYYCLCWGFGLLLAFSSSFPSPSRPPRDDRGRMEPCSCFCFRPVSPLGESETFRTFTNRHQQLLAQFFLAGILRQIQLIEAGMCRGQDVFAPVRTMNVEATNTIRPVERFESIERNLQKGHDNEGE